MGARQQLAQALTEALAGTDVQVEDTPRRIDRAEHPVVQVIRKEISKNEKAPRGSLVTLLDVLVIAPYQDVEGGEDELDNATDAVLEVLEPLGWVAWEKAERSTYNDMYPCYRIPTTALTTITTKNLETTDG